MDASKLAEIEAYIKEKLNDKLVEIACAYGELNVTIARENLLSVLFFLRDDPQCSFIGFIDISGVDYPDRSLRFEVVYHLLSPHHNVRIRVKTATKENEPIASACVVYSGAEWYEREIFDLFGVLFLDHPDLRRILTDYGFVGHPLRKDFPTTGFVECRYDNQVNRVIYEPVLLRQEMRNFDYMSPWEGTNSSIVEQEKLKIESDNG